MVNLNTLQINDHVIYKNKAGSFEATVTGIGLKMVGIRIYLKDFEYLPKPVFKNVNPNNLTLKFKQ